MRERIIRALAAGAHADRRRREIAARARARASSRARRSRRIERTAGSLRRIRRGSPCRRSTRSARALARQAPLATRTGRPTPRFEERAQPLYEAAVRAALAAAPSRRSRLAAAARASRQRRARRSRCCRRCSRKRDQWIRELVARTERDAFRARSRRRSRDEIRGELGDDRRAVSAGTRRARCRRSQRHAAATRGRRDARAAIGRGTRACAEAGGMPPRDGRGAERLARARVVAAGRGRAAASGRRSTRDDGFPPGGTRRRRLGAASAHDAMDALLAALAAVPGLADALHVAAPPAAAALRGRRVGASSSRCSTAAACSPRELTLAFRDAGAIDFTQGTLARARRAGQRRTRPPTCCSRSTARIDHLLVDEFQDTSFTQLELLRRLTAGWQPRRRPHALRRRRSDAVDLSLSRRRGAALRRGAGAAAAIGGRPGRESACSHAISARTPALVAWVNSDLSRRARRAQRSVARRRRVRAGGRRVGARARARGARSTSSPTTASEARAVVDHVRAALDGGRGSVAVLVRARAHLDALLPALRAAGIALRGGRARRARRAPGDPRSRVADARAHPARRSTRVARRAARAVVRARAGRSLRARRRGRRARRQRSIAGVARCAGADRRAVAPTARARLQRVARCLRPALGARGRAALAARVRGAWLALGGPATLDEAIDLDAAERFFALLAEHDVAGDVPDWPAFVAALASCYAAPDRRRDRARAGDDAASRQGARVRHGDPARARAPAQPRRERSSCAGARARTACCSRRSRARGGDADPVYAYLGPARRRRGSRRARAAALRRLHAREAPPASHRRARRRARVDGRPAVEAAAAARRSRDCWRRARRDDVAAAARAHAAVVPAPHAPRLAAACRVGMARRRRPPPASPSRQRPSRRATTLPFDWARETARASAPSRIALLAQIAREGLAAWSDARDRGAGAARPRGARRRRASTTRELDARGRARSIGVVATCSPIRAAAGCSTRRTRRRAANGRSPASTAGDVAHVAHRSHASSPTACAGSSTSRRARTKAPTPRRSSTAKRERYRDQLERYARFVRALDRAPDPPRPLPSAAARLARMAVRRQAAGGGDARKSVKIHGLCSSITRPSVRVIRGLPPSADGPVALTIGNFDGVHRGHQAMLARLIEAAEDLALPPAVLTFDPHAARVLRARQRRRRGCRRCATSSSSSARAASRARIVARFDAPARLARRRRRSSTTCSCAASACAGCWSARTSASARAAPATSRRCARRRRRSASRRCAPSRSTASARRRPRCARRSRRATSTHAAALLGRPFTICGPRRARREARPHARAFRRPTCRCKRMPPVAGIFAVRVHGLGARRATGVASVGVRPTVVDGAASRCSKSSSSTSTRRSTAGASASNSCTSCATRSATPTSTRSTRQIRADVAEARDFFARLRATR